MKNILLIHQNLPSQFNNLITYLKSHPGVNLVGVKEKNLSTPYSNHSLLQGMNIVEYTLPEQKKSSNQLERILDTSIQRGKLLVQIAEALIKQNFIPDIVIAHSGWGETLFLKDRFPDARLVILQEFFHGPNSPDINFDPEFQVDRSVNEIAVMQRSLDLQACFDADTIITPTQWQASLIPFEFAKKVRVVHDGIDTSRFMPNHKAQFQLPTKRTVTKKDKVITYIARGLEPYRGFHSFVRSIPAIQRQDKEIEIVIVGNDNVYYSPRLNHPTLTYREHYFKQIQNKADFSKIHVYDKLPQQRCIELMQVSRAHAYYTYPLFSSLTILEAMSCGCTVLGSKTGPVEEFIQPNRTGHLFPFFGIQEFANLAVHVVNDKTHTQEAIGNRARNFIKSCLDWETRIQPFWTRLIDLTP